MILDEARDFFVVDERRLGKECHLKYLCLVRVEHSVLDVELERTKLTVNLKLEEKQCRFFEN
jgi:hypothetical protein